MSRNEGVKRIAKVSEWWKRMNDGARDVHDATLSRKVIGERDERANICCGRKECMRWGEG